MSDEPNDTMRERADGSGFRLWVLMRMNRYALAGAIMVGLFATIVALGFVGLNPLSVLSVQDPDAIQTLFSSMVGPIITGVTLVATIGQLVLSQELGAVGDQRERMQEAMEFRRDIESKTEQDVSPPEPAAFLRELVAGIEDHAEALRDAVAGNYDGELEREIIEYVEALDDHAEAVREKIENTQFGTFDVIWTALDFNYSWKIFQARQLRSEYGDSLSEEADGLLDELIVTLQFFGPAREHFKTLYFQHELINLSRALLYTGPPALVVVAAMIMYVDPNTLPGTLFGIERISLLVSGAFVLTLAPFVLLVSFVLRIATVAQRTLAMGPFILRESSRDADSDV
ncbi:hypothetical protein [Halalkalicoccus jeotgali]|uniref:Uncharacterized protein n=1 Tax=Halalkalicoccus jeotgali (strain DSM 18796 / CECT 7217 / JCM 14584 / KCTC 4019 / B3) TaxID=795797 RepID=D8JAE2_HALJB|nr:hypothetical protein [Halalkalicoccus jeotgali]ADJ14664.1 hypothetical protein HacjB3_06365 [Halalkalicoccus jeotgali B3]ELY39562.1 hypothetical protein C497_04762 [Halalkalicoccus jeotgali B3]